MSIRLPSTRALHSGLLGIAAAAFAGCSSMSDALSGDKYAYQSEARQTSGLEVPPDLTQLAREGRYQAPAPVVSANASAAPARPLPTTTSSVAPLAVGDAKIERDGNVRWLAVSRPPEQLWSQVRQFWIDSGFTLAIEEPQVGVMETDWAENRAKLPSDLVRNTIGKYLEGLYDTSERDRFRTRIERSASGGSEIYVSNKRLAEVYTSSLQDDVRWELQPADRQLEAEFLSRLMIRLGTPEAVARAELAAPATAPALARARLVPDQPTATLEVNEGFEQAWRRVGLALDRSGFSVEDRNRADGFYYVRYIPGQAADNRGFFTRLFSSDDAGRAERYRISVKGTGATSLVAVQTADGLPVPADVGQRIAGVLLNDLK